MSPFYLLFVLRGDNTRVGGQERQDTGVGDESIGLEGGWMSRREEAQGFGRWVARQ